jgi:hypothetical protein
MNREMMERKKVFPRPFRALPEGACVVARETQGLSLRSGALG